MPFGGYKASGFGRELGEYVSTYKCNYGPTMTDETIY